MNTIRNVLNARDERCGACIVYDIHCTGWCGRQKAKAAEEVWDGQRKDAGKKRLNLVPWLWIKALGHVFHQGGLKYDYTTADGTPAWNTPMDWSRVVASLWRHWGAWMEGERWDPETGCHHLAQVAWNVLTLMTYDLLGLGKDDLRRELNRAQPWNDAKRS